MANTGTRLARLHRVILNMERCMTGENEESLGTCRCVQRSKPVNCKMNKIDEEQGRRAEKMLESLKSRLDLNALGFKRRVMSYYFSRLRAIVTVVQKSVLTGWWWGRWSVCWWSVCWWSRVATTVQFVRLYNILCTEAIPLTKVCAAIFAYYSVQTTPS